MTRAELNRLERELQQFLSSIVVGQGRPERRAALEQYVVGLLLDGERKSVGPIAARLAEDPKQADAIRQKLQQCLSGSAWDQSEMWQRLASKVEAELPGLEALVIDDTGFAKKGDKSVGVARQYSGTLGRTDNCQVATSLHLAGEAGSACIGLQLYLPEQWTKDRQRRRAAGVDDSIVFQKKWEIALGLLDLAMQWGVRRHVVLADAGYGDAPDFRDGIRSRGLLYVVGIAGNHHVWPPGARVHVPGPTGRRGRPRTLHTAANGQRHVSIADLAATLSYRRVVWREGSKGPQSSRFAAVRVRSAEGHEHKRPPSEEQWLLCEWPEGEKAPTKFWLSSLPSTTTLRRLVKFAKLRWRVERDYQDLKQEIGLDHFEGRSWTGFHRHALLCSVAHAFLAIRRSLFPPEHRSLDPSNGPARSAVRSAA